MSILLTALLLAPEIPDRDADIKFARWEMFDARLDTVEIWTKAGWKDGQQLPPTAIMRRTISYRPELNLKGETRYFADSAGCPAVLNALASLAVLPTPKIAVPNLPQSENAITGRADGAVFRLSTKAYFPLELGTVEMTFGTETPVANWIDQSFRALAPCWNAPKPSR